MWSSWPWVRTTAVDLVEPVTDRGEVGQDHVDAGLVLLGEQHAAVDDQQLAGVLEDGHVAADLAEPTECDDPQAPVGQFGGLWSSGWGWLMGSRYRYASPHHQPHPDELPVSGAGRR